MTTIEKIEKIISELKKIRNQAIEESISSYEIEEFVMGTTDTGLKKTYILKYNQEIEYFETLKKSLIEETQFIKG